MPLTEAPERLLDRVRKLLAQAEDDGVTPAEAQAFTAKAAELMAKYGIDRALLAADQPETDQPANRILDIDNPWAREKAHLLCGLAAALRCQCILLGGGSRPGSRVHIFGFASDIDRTDVLYTSVLIQMAHGLAGARVPEWSSSPRAWRRSWLLGFATAVISRVREAEYGAVVAATKAGNASSDRTAVVLADRSLIIRKHVEDAYPVTRKAKVTYSGSGYRDGYSQGQRADIGTSRISPKSGRALTGSSAAPR
ncbi:MAG TPA: DUF2786 domain-containing protein [Streptosporangiaceae bacterium]|nr:DUF2786 domain-containing protein [Streptosporangiaceae bacterium]